MSREKNGGDLPEPNEVDRRSQGASVVDAAPGPRAGYTSGGHLRDRPYKVVLLHGIRDRAEWMARVTRILQEDPRIEAIPVGYDYLDVFRFLLPLPGLRGRAFKKTLRALNAIRADTRTEQMSVVAHSFGTYVITKLLAHESHLELDHLILCGGIVPKGFDWGKVKRQIGGSKAPTINDCGWKDIWPILAEAVTFLYGASGTWGFKHNDVRDRYFPYKHSTYFRDDHVRRYWLPCLQGHRIPDGEDPPKTPWILSALPLAKYAVLGGLALWGGWTVTPSVVDWFETQSTEKPIVQSKPLTAIHDIGRDWRITPELVDGSPGSDSPVGQCAVDSIPAGELVGNQVRDCPWAVMVSHVRRFDQPDSLLSGLTLEVDWTPHPVQHPLTPLDQPARSLTFTDSIRPDRYPILAKVGVDSHDWVLVREAAYEFDAAARMEKIHLVYRKRQWANRLYDSLSLLIPERRDEALRGLLEVLELAPSHRSAYELIITQLDTIPLPDTLGVLEAVRAWVRGAHPPFADTVVSNMYLNASLGLRAATEGGRPEIAGQPALISTVTGLREELLVEAARLWPNSSRIVQHLYKHHQARGDYEAMARVIEDFLLSAELLQTGTVAQFLADWGEALECRTAALVGEGVIGQTDSACGYVDTTKVQVLAALGTTIRDEWSRFACLARPLRRQWRVTPQAPALDLLLERGENLGSQRVQE